VNAMVKLTKIPVPPTSLNWPPLGGRWFHWLAVEPCFWPGPGGRSTAVDAQLAEIRDYGGVYLLAWSEVEPPRKNPQRTPEVKYIGETHWFKGRMEGFGNSAAFWGPRSAGHSAGWSWPEGEKDKLWVAFFDVLKGLELEVHLRKGLRCWVEAVALEEHRLANGALPQLNAVKRNQVVAF
jgi:hypothetical protein